MDYEKMYKEAVGKIQELLEEKKKKEMTNCLFEGELNEIFPELKEKIRKDIIGYLQYSMAFDKSFLDKKYNWSQKDCSKWIAWLKKQGEHAKFRDSIQVGDKVTRNEDGVLVNLSQLKRVAKPAEVQGEQKSSMIQWKGDNLKEVVDFTGVYKEGFEKWFHNSWEEYEKYVHEHGDIFKIFNEDGSHIEVPIGAWIIKAPDGYITASRFGVSPILTELSIESNFKFKKAIEAIENYVNSFPHSQRPEIWQHINFLKSFKDRVQPQSNQKWSEEDENLLKLSLENLTELKDRFGKEYGKVGDCIIWLESIRPQSLWKPSERQKEALLWCVIHLGGADKQTLGELLEELNKL